MNSWQVRLIRLLLFFIPNSNPDNEKFYPQIVRWLLEIDEAGTAIREVGLNAEGVALFCAPNDRNFGFWTDSNMSFNAADIELVNQEFFESMWAKLNPSVM